LSHSPELVALVQTAIGLPVVFMALPAGALADVLDVRLPLLAAQTWMLLVAAGLSVLTALDAVTPAVLLAFTFLLGFGNAANMPAWRA
jgi:MFS family permease